MRAIRDRFILAAMIAALILVPTIASAQTEGSSPFWNITKSVVFDPTTYAPASLFYTSTKMDWNSSQPLFRNGWIEQNHDFTVTGRPNDTPMSFADGNRKIRQMALHHLTESIINNAATNIFEGVLSAKYPQHRKLFKTLSWVERIAFASAVSYAASANHFEQAQRNRELARQHGYR